MSQSVRKEYQMCLDHMSLQMTDKVVFLSSDGSEVSSIDGHLYQQTCPETPLIFWKSKNRRHVHRSV